MAHRHRRLAASTSPRSPRGSHEVRTGTKVTSVLETADGVEVTDGNGDVTSYDAVVIATHPGQALAMLAEPTAAQREVLGALPYSPNVALLHTDASRAARGRQRPGVLELPPPRRRAAAQVDWSPTT